MNHLFCEHKEARKVVSILIAFILAIGGLPTAFAANAQDPSIYAAPAVPTKAYVPSPNSSPSPSPSPVGVVAAPSGASQNISPSGVPVSSTLAKASGVSTVTTLASALKTTGSSSAAIAAVKSSANAQSGTQANVVASASSGALSNAGSSSRSSSANSQSGTAAAAGTTPVVSNVPGNTTGGPAAQAGVAPADPGDFAFTGGLFGSGSSSASGGATGGVGSVGTGSAMNAALNLPGNNLLNNPWPGMNYQSYPEVFDPLITANNNLITDLTNLKTDIENALQKITGKDGVMDKVNNMDRLMMNLQAKILARGNQMTAAEIAAIAPVAPISRAELANCMRNKLQGQRDMRAVIVQLNQALMQTSMLLVNAQDRALQLQRLRNEKLPSKETAMNMAWPIQNEISRASTSSADVRSQFNVSKNNFTAALNNFVTPISTFLGRVKQVIDAFIAAGLFLNEAKQETLDAYNEAAGYLGKLK